MIVSVLVIKKHGKIVVILGDYDKDDLVKEMAVNAQLVTCLEKFKQWAENQVNIEVMIDKRPDLLSEEPKYPKEELSKLTFRLPLWLKGSSKDIKVNCADTRDYNLMDRSVVLQQWISGDVKIHNLTKTTWSSYVKSVRKFVAEHTNKKNPLMVKGLLETLTEKTEQEYLITHQIFGEKKLMQRQILYHSFKKCRESDRNKFLLYFRHLDHMIEDVLYIKALHTSLNTSSRFLFIASQTHAHTMSQYLIHGAGFEKEFSVEHRSDNASVELKALAQALDALKKRKKKRNPKGGE
ncbi:hypothetical protein AAMO2058_001677300 [Amorphochlora amoebiformis]